MSRILPQHNPQGSNPHQRLLPRCTMQYSIPQRSLFLPHRFSNRIISSAKLFKLAIPRRAVTYPKPGQIVHRMNVYLFYPQSGYTRVLFLNKNMKNDRLSLVAFIPKQKSKLPSRVSSMESGNPSTMFSSSPASDRDLFSPARTLLSPSLATSCIHTSFTKRHSICIHNAYNILIYFESIITKCTSYIMTLHKSNMICFRIFHR